MQAPPTQLGATAARAGSPVHGVGRSRGLAAPASAKGAVAGRVVQSQTRKSGTVVFSRHGPAAPRRKQGDGTTAPAGSPKRRMGGRSPLTHVSVATASVSRDRSMSVANLEAMKQRSSSLSRDEHPAFIERTCSPRRALLTLFILAVDVVAAAALNIASGGDEGARAYNAAVYGTMSAVAVPCAWVLWRRQSKRAITRHTFVLWVVPLALVTAGVRVWSVFEGPVLVSSWGDPATTTTTFKVARTASMVTLLTTTLVVPYLVWGAARQRAARAASFAAGLRARPAVMSADFSAAERSGSGSGSGNGSGSAGLAQLDALAEHDAFDAGDDGAHPAGGVPARSQSGELGSPTSVAPRARSRDRSTSDAAAPADKHGVISPSSTSMGVCAAAMVIAGIGAEVLVDVHGDSFSEAAAPALLVLWLAALALDGQFGGVVGGDNVRTRDRHYLIVIAFLMTGFPVLLAGLLNALLKWAGEDSTRQLIAVTCYHSFTGISSIAWRLTSTGAVSTSKEKVPFDFAFRFPVELLSEFVFVQVEPFSLAFFVAVLGTRVKDLVAHMGWHRDAWSWAVARCKVACCEAPDGSPPSCSCCRRQDGGGGRSRSWTVASSHRTLSVDAPDDMHRAAVAYRRWRRAEFTLFADIMATVCVAVAVATEWVLVDAGVGTPMLTQVISQRSGKGTLLAAYVLIVVCQASLTWLVRLLLREQLQLRRLQATLQESVRAVLQAHSLTAVPEEDAHAVAGAASASTATDDVTVQVRGASGGGSRSILKDLGSSTLELAAVSKPRAGSGSARPANSGGDADAEPRHSATSTSALSGGSARSLVSRAPGDHGSWRQRRDGHKVDRESGRISLLADHWAFVQSLQVFWDTFTPHFALMAPLGLLLTLTAAYAIRSASAHAA